MAEKFSPLKTQNNNFVDETILSTPLPESTSTVKRDRNQSHVDYNKPHQMAAAGSRPSSLGLIDIDALLANETINNSQEVMESLYKIRDRRNNSPSNALEMKSSTGEKYGSLLSYKPNTPAISTMNSQTPKVDGSLVGVPSMFLTSDSIMSEANSFRDTPSVSHKHDLSMSANSAEVAAIMGKASSFDSGRVTFEPEEVSARSTSLGVSDHGSKHSKSRISSVKKNDEDFGFGDEDFVANECDLIKKLEKDEVSFKRNNLPPFIPDCDSEHQKLDISRFSGVFGEKQIVVRPSWIGLEGENDEPINMSVGEFFRLKSDVLSSQIDGSNSLFQRPNFGMDIKSPKRNGRRIALASDSFSETDCPTPSAPQSIPQGKFNETQVITPPQRLTFVERIGNPDETAGNRPDLSVIRTPSISLINDIMSEIDANDSPTTMANKFLRHSSSNSKYEKNIEKSLIDKSSSRNDLVSTLPDQDNSLTSQPGMDELAHGMNVSGKTEDKKADSRFSAVLAEEQVNRKYEMNDLIKKLNLIDMRGQADRSSIKCLVSIVHKLKNNVTGPLDCSALYETLDNELACEGQTNADNSIITYGPIKEEGEMSSVIEESQVSNSWVEIPEELLLAPEEGNVMKYRHCVGIGFTAHVPIKNVTNSWLMYEVSLLKNHSSEGVIVQQLPVRTLLSPNHCAEFEAIVVPVSAGNHSTVLQIKVDDCMAQEKTSKTYLCKLTLAAAVPKVMLVAENMMEVKVGEVVEFGLLPEECRKKLVLNVLNTGRSDIPVRLVLEEMPSSFQPFEICDAKRSPLVYKKNSINQSECDTSRSGISLERKDLLACDLTGSGPHSMVAFTLAFNSPKIKDIPKSSSCFVDSSKKVRITARLKVELDVPASLPSKFTVLQEVILSGVVGMTKLNINSSSNPLRLYSKEANLPLDSSSGRNSQSRMSSKGQKLFAPVSECVYLANAGVVPLDMKISICTEDVPNSGCEDIMRVTPDSLTLQPGEKFPLKITYQPAVGEIKECERTMVIVLHPDGPWYEVQVKGIPAPIKNQPLPWKEMAKLNNLSRPRSSISSDKCIIQSTHQALVWGSVPVGSDFSELGFALKNSSDMFVRMDLAVVDCDDYKFLNRKSDMVGKASFDLLPNQIEKIKVFFRPKKLGPAAGKLSISVFDMKDADRNLKNRMIRLYGYGGYCKVETISLPRDVGGCLLLNLGLISLRTSGSNAPNFNHSPRLRPSSPSSLLSVGNRFQIDNSGTLPAFVKIVPVALGIDVNSLSHLEEAVELSVTVRPDAFQLKPSATTTVWVNYNHGFENDNGSKSSKNTGSKRIQEAVAKLIIVSGDVPTRNRLQRMYKIASAAQGNVDPNQCLGLAGTSLSFIGAIFNKEEITTELIEETLDGKEDMSVISLYDPPTKESVNSIVRYLSTLEITLVVERDESSNEDVSSSSGDLTLCLANNQLEFHTLLDDGDNTLFHFPEEQYLDGDMKENQTSGETWSIEPKGTIYLSSCERSASLTLRSSTHSDIFFETRLGIKRDEDGGVEWLPSHRGHASLTSKCPLTVEPLQGQLVPFGSVTLNVSLPQITSCSSSDAVLQIYSENHCLKINIRVDGLGPQAAVKQSGQKNYGDLKGYRSGMSSLGGNHEPNQRKDLRPSEGPMPRKTNTHKENHVYPDATAKIFPETKVGNCSSVIVKLSNVSSEPHEIQFHAISSPFQHPKGKIVVKGRHYASFSVKFQPETAGFYQSTLVMNAVSQLSSAGNVIAVSLKGSATE